MDEVRIYKIKKAFAEKRQRRADRVCRTYSLKLKVSDQEAERLDLMFVHARYFYNDIIKSDNIFEFKVTNEVRVFDFDLESKEWTFKEVIPSILSAQQRHGIHARAKQNIINLGKAKAKGIKVGPVKPVKFVNSIPLKQFGQVFKINWDENKVNIQCAGWFKVFGLKQINREADISVATLTKDASGYYLKVCVYEFPVETGNEEPIGLDFGIKDSVTSSTGEKFNWKFDYSRIKKLHKSLSRKKRGSKNRKKAKKKLRKAYLKITRKKDGCANEFAHQMKKHEKVVIQDENLSGWHQGFFGKKIQQTILGRLKSKISNLPNAVVVNRFFPSTQICPQCNSLNKFGLEQRDYRCECGYHHEDRDVKAAQSILKFGLTGGEAIMPVETSKARAAQATCASESAKQEAEV